MIITFDLGNSDLSFAVFKGEELIASFRTSSDRKRSVDEYAKVIKELLFSKDINIGEVEGSILSSVVPQLTRAVESAIKRVLGTKPMVLGPGMKTGLAIRADNPTEVGADLVAGCVGAIKKYQSPIIIVDLGTATKIMAINKSGAFCGVVISPGVKTSTDYLVRIASQLPYISLIKPKKVLATNTVDAMNSGIVNGTGCMIDGMIAKFEKELGYKTTRILTGGLATPISVAVESEHIVDKSLIFYGLKDIYYRNLETKNEK